MRVALKSKKKREREKKKRKSLRFSVSLSLSFFMSPGWLLVFQPSHVHFQQEESGSLVEEKGTASLLGQHKLSF